MSKKNSFKKVFYELFILTLGILIALFINGWKEDYDNRKYVAKTIKSIHEELKENISEIEKTIPFQDSLDTSIYNYLENDKSITDIIINFGGFLTPVIKASAWKAILNNNIHLIEYKMVSKLSEIEKGSEEIEYKIKNIIEFIYQNSKATSRQKKEVFSVMISDLIITEEEMVRIMKEFLEEEKSK